MCLTAIFVLYRKPTFLPVKINPGYIAKNRRFSIAQRKEQGNTVFGSVISLTDDEEL